MNDQQIIELYFARDEQAIVETDKSHGRVCMQVSMNILHSHPDAEECVNDTYLKAWNSIPPERPTYFHVSDETPEKMTVSAGVRGAQLLMDREVLVRFVDGVLVDVAE